MRQIIWTFLFFSISYVTAMGQSEFYFSVQDASGHRVSGADVKAFQDDLELQVEDGDPFGYQYRLIFDREKDLKLIASHSDYQIDIQKFSAPHQVFSTVLSAGKPSDHHLILNSSRRYFEVQPDLIAILLNPSTIEVKENSLALQTWMKDFGLEEAESPWPVDEQNLNEEEIAEERLLFLRKRDKSAFSDNGIPALEAIRTSELIEFGGILIWPRAILGHTMKAKSCNASIEWLESKGIEIQDPLSRNQLINIKAPEDSGINMVKLYHEMLDSGFFEDLWPDIYTFPF